MHWSLPRRVIALAAFAAAALVAIPIHASGADPLAPPRARPLNLPNLAAGARCPASRTFFDKQNMDYWLGGGPLYMVQPGPWINLAAYGAQPDEHGFRGQKLPLEINRSYRGPLLIRARRLDGPAKIRFWQPPPAADYERALAWRSIPSDNPSGRYWFMPSGIYTTHTGCVGFQIDGTSFSEKLIVNVIIR